MRLARGTCLHFGTGSRTLSVTGAVKGYTVSLLSV